MKFLTTPRKNPKHAMQSAVHHEHAEIPIVMEGVVAPNSFQIHGETYQAGFIRNHHERHVLVFDSNTRIPGLNAEELEVLRKNIARNSFMIEGKKVLIKGVVSSNTPNVIHVRTFLTLSEHPNHMSS